MKTYQEWTYAKTFDHAENFSRNFELKDLVPKQIYDKIFNNFEEGNMTFQNSDNWRESIRLGRDRMTSFTAEDAEVNQDMIDQMIVTEIIGEVVDATNKIFNEHLKKHGISATSIRSDSIVADVRKRLYDDLKPLVEPKMKEETKMENFNIQLDLIGVDYDMDELRRRVQGSSGAPELLRKKFDVGAPVRHPSLIANRIWQNDGRHTTVEWRDGTKTTVCCEDPEKYTEWGGFCACVTKKLYGSATKAEFELETAKKTTAWPAKKKQMEREKIKAMKQREARLRKEQRERKIANKMEEMRITNEAGHRLAKEYSEKETAVAAEEG